MIIVRQVALCLPQVGRGDPLIGKKCEMLKRDLKGALYVSKK